MLATALDLDSLVAVLIIAPPPVPDEWVEYCNYIEGMNEKATRAVAGTRPVLLQIMREGVAMPSPRERKMMADLRGKIRPSAVNAVVCDSAVLRMMGIALDWIRKPHYASKWHGDLASATAFIEAELGHAVPQLKRLLEDAENQLAERLRPS